MTEPENRRKDWIKELGIFCLFLVLFSFNYVINLYINTDLYLVIVWLLFIGYVIFSRLEFLIRYFYILFIQATNLIGVFIIENSDIWLPELAVFSTDKNSLFPLAVIHWLFFHLLYFFDILLADAEPQRIIRQMKEEKVASELILVVFFIVVTILLNRGLMHPAFSFGFDRFQYAKVYLAGRWDTLFTVMNYLIPVCAVMLLSEHRGFTAAVLVLLVGMLLLFGYKFGAFLDILYLLSPILIIKIGKNYKTIFRIITGLILVLVLVVFGHNSLTYGKSLSSNFTYLLQRTAQQGQLWWALYDQEPEDTLHVDELGDETKVFFTNDLSIKTQYDYGIYKIMRIVTPSDLFENKINNGSRYAASTSATVFYYFKYYGFLIYLPLTAFVFAYIVNRYYRHVMAGDCIESIIAGRYMLVMLNVMIQSDFHVLFSRRMVLFLFVYIYLRIFRSHGKEIIFHHNAEEDVA